MSETVESMTVVDPDLRKVRMTVSLMEALIGAAAGRGNRIEWGEPDEEGFYTPTVYLTVETPAIP